MFWRVAHEFLRWVFPALFAFVVAIATLTISAAQVWPEAKAAAGGVFANAIAMLNNPWTYVLLIAIFSAWLAAFIWSGQKLGDAKPSETDPFAGIGDLDEIIEFDGGDASGVASRH